MSSNASTVETGVSDDSPTTGGITVTDRTRTHSDVERRLLVERIERLERELVRERHRRDQVVEQYERLLSEERERDDEDDGGWLRNLF